MKKIVTFILVIVMVLAISVPSFAHPMVPDQSIGNVSANAANGMHTAWGHVQNAEGIAAHVFTMRHSPH